MKIPLRSATIAMLLPLAGTACAQAPAARAGSMTLAQFQQRQSERMLAADTDGDGRISLAEWTARPARGKGDPAKLFKRMDANHDGFLDKTEIQSALAFRFRRMDTNGDGIVMPDERMAARNARQKGGDKSDGE